MIAFQLWKDEQRNSGHLNFAKQRRPNSSCYPFSSQCGWGAKYFSFVRNCRKSNKGDNHLSFMEWLHKMYEGGLDSPEQYGRGLSKYCLGRIGDKGDYTIDNCRVISNRKNASEQKENGATNSESMLGEDNPKWNGRHLHTPAGKFTSAKLAAEANHCTIDAINGRCISVNYPEYWNEYTRT